jgi:hypothetical protein
LLATAVLNFGTDIVRNLIRKKKKKNMKEITKIIMQVSKQSHC